MFDICKHVEHGGEISDLNDLGPVVLSRLVKFYLLRQRELDQARILAKMEKHTKSVTPTGGKGGKKSPGAGAPKGKGSKAASAKGKVFHICSLESLDSCKTPILADSESRKIIRAIQIAR